MLLLTIIYLAFISLGLPDAVLGSAWPIISQDINTSLEYAGAVSFVISAGTVISSLMAARIIFRFGTGKVLAFSVLATAAALLGFAFSYHLFAMVLLAIPLGLGGGAVDAALNNFVALNYKAKHMNYLHSFWGVGATAGPFIMATYLLVSEGWRDGYLTLAVIQFILVIALFLTIPLWKNTLTSESNEGEQQAQEAPVSNTMALAIKGVKSQLFIFCCYCSLEAGTGLWAASYLTQAKGVAASDAAFWTAMFFLGITAGRFACGMIADKINEERLIQVGTVTILIGVLGLIAPVPLTMTQLSLVLIGLGCAPIYPNTMHLTPQRFGKNASQAIIGLSMATAYTGITLVPPAMGMVVGALSFSYFPFILLLLSIAMLVVTEQLSRTTHRASPTTNINAEQKL